jgi:hypothetical protein
MYAPSRIASVVLAAGISVVACATAGKSEYAGAGMGGSSGGASGGGGGGSSGGGPLDLGGDDGSTDAKAPRAQRCDDAGRCSCFNIASIGRPGCTGCEGASGGGDTTTSFVDYLNQHSSAKVDLYASKPALTADFLAQYDVVILQGLFDSCGTVGAVGGNSFWTFGSNEADALATWVNAGGGLITLTGFVADPAEVTAMNTLLMAVTHGDLTYGTSDICNQTGVYCQGESTSLGGWSQGPIGTGVTDVGCFHGHPVTVSGTTAVVDDHDVDFPQDVAAAHEKVGMGHVVVYEDEWITYTSQWPGGGGGPACEQGCAADAEPGVVYQVPELWQNMINYAATATMCPMFTINVLQ